MMKNTAPNYKRLEIIVSRFDVSNEFGLLQDTDISSGMAILQGLIDDEHSKVQKKHKEPIEGKFDIEFDYDFTLKAPDIVSCSESSYVIGDRWSPSDAPDVDDRRKSNLIKSSGIVDSVDTYYLDYTDSLMYNLSIIHQNPNPFITTFTGIAVLADLMKKETIVLWDDEMGKWQGNKIEYEFKQHFFSDRGCKLVHINEFKL